jgi:hypothetical protein
MPFVWPSGSRLSPYLPRPKCSMAWRHDIDSIDASLTVASVEASSRMNSSCSTLSGKGRTSTTVVEISAARRCAMKPSIREPMWRFGSGREFGLLR